MSITINTSENKVSITQGTQTLTITNNNNGNTVSVKPADNPTVTIAAPGPKGATGATGAAGSGSGVTSYSELSGIPNGIISSSLHIFTAITASGNISSSGNNYVSAYYTDNYLSLGTNGTQGRVFSDGFITGIQIGRNGTPNKNIELLGPVTASNISASGDIQGSSLTTDQYVYHAGDPNTYLNFTNDRLRIFAGGISYLDLDDSTVAPHNLTINDGKNNLDFIVKGDNDNPLFKTDASANRIGTHGKGTPEVAFHIGGSELRVDGNISGSSAIFDNNVSASKFYAADGLYHSDDVLENTHITFPTGDKVQITAGDVNFIHAHQVDADINKLTFNDDNTDTDIIFRGAVGSNNNLLRLDASAMKIGIGTGTPSEALTVEGNISGSGNLKIDGSQVDFTNLPTSDPGVAGRLYNDSGTIKISL